MPSKATELFGYFQCKVFFSWSTKVISYQARQKCEFRCWSREQLVCSSTWKYLVSFWVPRKWWWRRRRWICGGRCRFCGHGGFGAALVALIITWRVTIKAEIRPLCVCVQCSSIPGLLWCNGVRTFPKIVRKKSTSTITLVKQPVNQLLKKGRIIFFTAVRHAAILSILHDLLLSWQISQLLGTFFCGKTWC